MSSVFTNFLARSMDGLEIGEPKMLRRKLVTMVLILVLVKYISKQLIQKFRTKVGSRFEKACGPLFAYIFNEIRFLFNILTV